MHVAARNGNEPVVDCLFDHGAKVDLRNKVLCSTSRCFSLCVHKYSKLATCPIMDVTRKVFALVFQRSKVFCEIFVLSYNCIAV